MHRVSEKEEQLILDDIKRRGVVTEDLQHNLLDHVCCIIENEMPEGVSFLGFYESIIPRFFNKELKELQVETDNLIRFKNYYAMKKTLYIAGIVSSLMTILGAIFKTFHLQGASVLIVLGGLSFSFIFLPLIIALKFKDEESKTDKLVFGIGFLFAILVSVGVMFKLMHWPMANILMQVGITGFVFGYVPLYFITRVRRPELKFNTMVNTVLMLACGGFLYAMFNLGHSHYVRDSFFVMHQNMRHQVDNSNQELEERTAELNDSLKIDVQNVLEATAALKSYIERIRVNSIVTTQNTNEVNAATMNITSMSWGVSAERLQDELMDPEKELNGLELKQKILDWKKTIVESGLSDEDLEHWVDLDGMTTLEFGKQSWEEAHFGHATVVSVVTYLDQLSLELNMRTIQYLNIKEEQR